MSALPECRHDEDKSVAPDLVMPLPAKVGVGCEERQNLAPPKCTDSDTHWQYNTRVISIKLKCNLLTNFYLVMFCSIFV